MKTKTEVLIDLFKESKIGVDELFKIAKNDFDVDILFEIVNKNVEFLNKTTFDIVLNANECTEKSILILEKILSIDSNLCLIDELFLLKMLKMTSQDYENPLLAIGEPYMIRCAKIKAFELIITNKIIDNFDYFLNNLITAAIKSYKTNSIVTKYLKNIILQKIHTDNNVSFKNSIGKQVDLLDLYNTPIPETPLLEVFYRWLLSLDTFDILIIICLSCLSSAWFYFVLIIYVNQFI